MSRKEKSSGERRFRVAPDAATEVVGERASSTGVLLFSAVLFVAVLAAVLGIGWLTVGRVTLEVIVVAALAALLAIGCCHVAQQWERVVVLRLGRFNRVSGPGLFWTIPVIESNTMRVDTRTRVTTFYAEETLTADLVPMNVDAVLFWHVWDAAAACTEVGDFTRAVEMAAQTALRDAIGRASAAEVAIRREQLDRELKRVLEEKVAPWGVTVLSVEVRDILLPKELQEAMSLRTRVTTFYAEETLTADLVPMNVDTVLFWHVWDAAAACTEVGDFTRAVEMAAQTALRDAIGRASAAEVAIRREQLDRELKRVLEEKVAPWGVTILSVEVRDILLPKELQEAMSLEAQAEQRKKARIILMEAEHDIYEILGEMEELIGDHEAVARLRTMHLLNESLREGKGTVVIPSAFAEGFNEGVGDLFKG